MSTNYWQTDHTPTQTELNNGIAQARYERSMMFRLILSHSWRTMTRLFKRPVAQNTAESTAKSTSVKRLRSTIGVTERSMQASMRSGENLKRWLRPDSPTHIANRAQYEQDNTAKAA